MNHFSRMLALRYTLFSHKDSTVKFMMRLCFVGIFIGTFALMMTLIIMSGFEITIHNKMQGINADLIITPPFGSMLDINQIRPLLEQKFKHSIAGISGESTRQIIIDYQKKQSVIMLRGIEPAHAMATSTLAAHVTTSLADLSRKDLIVENGLRNDANLIDLLGEDSIIVGYKLAQNFGFSLGEKIFIYIPEPGQTKKIYLKKQSVTIAGFFRFGLEEYDQGFAFTNLATLQKFFDESTGVDQISIKKASPPSPSWFKKFFNRTWWLMLLGKFDPEKRLIDRIEAIIPRARVASWKDLYSPLVASLRLEKYVSFLILALISLVASLNMISLLVLFIQQKRRDLAILMAMGMPSSHLRNVFIIIGMSITSIASLCGLASAAFCGFLLKRYPFIHLPDVYYVSHLPAHMDLDQFLLVFACAMTIGFCATFIPARRAKKISIMKVIRAQL